MTEERCTDCSRPIMNVRVHGWSQGPEGKKIPLDFVKSLDGEYAMVGPDTAVYVKQEERPARILEGVPLYADHRRSCPNSKGEVVRPLFPQVRVICERCEASALIVDSEFANEAVKFITDHSTCKRKSA